MAKPSKSETNPEVDRLVDQMTRWLATSAPDSTDRFTLSREDVQWLLAEIDGGREAFGVVVQSNSALRERVATLEMSIGTLTTGRR